MVRWVVESLDTNLVLSFCLYFVTSVPHQIQVCVIIKQYHYRALLQVYASSSYYCAKFL